MTTCKLKDLEGRPGITTAQFARSRTAVVRIIRTGKTATTAGENGALNVWRDRSHVLHAAVYRRRVELNHTKRLTLTDLNGWLKTWWPELGTVARWS